MHRCRLTSLLFLLTALALPAAAAAAADTDTGGSAPEPGDANALAARDHYARGLELYRQQQYARALAEFEQAYALVPSPKLLFSIGQTHSGLHQHAEAFLALRAYLDSVGSSVPSERRVQVERQLEALRELVGSLDVTVDRAGATISVDGEDVGTSPLRRPMVVDAGRHHVSARLAGHVTSSARVSVIAGELTQLRFELLDLPASPEASLAKPLWIVTAILAAVTAGSGVVTLVNKHEYEQDLAQPHSGDPLQTSRNLESQRNRLDTWMLVTDVLAGATLISGGTALYFTLRSNSTEDGETSGAALLLNGNF